MNGFIGVLKTILKFIVFCRHPDNVILLKSLCDMCKDEITLNCVGNSCESFKSIDLKFKNMKYSFKLLDICNFIKGSLFKLSENLSDEDKIITKKHFPDNFDF